MPSPSDRRGPGHHALRVEGLTFQVRLGCTAQERAQPQEVRLDLEFRFDEAPPGCVTDELSDTVCYAEVASELAKTFENQEYKLIERLAIDAYEISRRVGRDRARVAIAARKVKPPVERLLGGVVYRCGDFTI